MKHIFNFIFSFILSIFIIAPPLNFAENHYVKCIGFGLLFGCILLVIKHYGERIEKLENEIDELNKKLKK